MTKRRFETTTRELNFEEIVCHGCKSKGNGLYECSSCGWLFCPDCMFSQNLCAMCHLDSSNEGKTRMRGLVSPSTCSVEDTEHAK